MHPKFGLFALVGMMGTTYADKKSTYILHFKDIHCSKDATFQSIVPVGRCRPLAFPSKSFRTFNATKGCDVYAYPSHDCLGEPNIKVLPDSGPSFCAAITKPVRSVELICK